MSKCKEIKGEVWNFGRRALLPRYPECFTRLETLFNSSLSVHETLFITVVPKACVGTREEVVSADLRIPNILTI